MIDIFSSRELATSIWVGAILIAIFVSKKIRGSALKVIKVALSKQLFIPFICMILYAGGFIVLFTRFSIWKWIYLKDVIIWVLFVGIPTCFSSISKNNQEGFYRDIILENLKLSVFVEFIISTFTLHIVAELIIIPVFTFLFMLKAVAENKEESKPAQKLISGLIFIATIIMLGFTIKEAVATYREIGIVDSIVSFCIPVTFSILYLPFAYLFSVIAEYQVLFIRMQSKEPPNIKTQRNHKRLVLRVCGLSHKNIVRFERRYLGMMYVDMGEEKFADLIYDFKAETGKNVVGGK